MVEHSDGLLCELEREGRVKGKTQVSVLMFEVVPLK